jgi:NHL repeat
LNGVISTVAGTGTRGFSGDGGPAQLADLNLSNGGPSTAGEVLAVDGQGNLYIAESLNERVRKVDLHGAITTVAGTGQPGFAGEGGSPTTAALDVPLGVAVRNDGRLYVADTENDRVRQIG